MSAIGGVIRHCGIYVARHLVNRCGRCFGGKLAGCPAYASGLLWKDDISDLADEAVTYIDRGFRRIKMRLARSKEYDMAAVQEVRKAIGPDNDVIIDASMRYHPGLARRMGKFFAQQGVFWYEEPFAPENIDAFVALRREVEIPLAAGENEFGLQGFRELIRAGAVNMVQPDASRCGGISEVWKVAKLAQEYTMRFRYRTDWE